MDTSFLDKILPVSIKMMAVLIFFSVFLLLLSGSKKPTMSSSSSNTNIVIIIVSIFSVILSYNIVKKLINNIKNMFC